MRETTGRTRRVSVKVKAAVAALLAIFAVAAFGASSANAAQGDPFNADFNYVGLNVNISIAGEVNELALTPAANLGNLEVNGTYTDNVGNFTIPKIGGLVFPDISLDLGAGIVVDGSIGLTESGTGNYNAATGALTMNPKISLTLGTNDIGSLPDPVGSLGSGPLSCKFSPLAVSLSTNPTNWPSPGKLFVDKVGLTDGAVSGAWNIKPDVQAIAGGTLCTIIHGFLGEVGGLYLANSTTDILAMPAPTGTKPAPAVCAVGQTGTPPNCVSPPVDVACPIGFTGIEPNCTKIDEPAGKVVFQDMTVTKKVSVKPGLRTHIKWDGTNRGDADGTIKVTLSSSNKQVKVPKSFTVSIPAGKTVTKKITVKATKKAKGKATITAKAAGLTAKSTITVKK